MSGAPGAPLQGAGVDGSSKNELPQLPRNIYAVRNGGEYKRSGRTIVVCLDGTGDKFDNDNSNIVHLVSTLKKADPSQVIYYQSGIGTYDGGGLTNGINAGLDMAVGSGLGVHVRDGYQFLMHNYHQGDKICLFGFSRGAYTARCLAGMIHKVGLLPAHNISQVQFAYQYYKDDTPSGWKMSEDFKRTFCQDVSVYFIGVFDSVASVGVVPRRLPLSATPVNKANYFRHAMALDERRAKFKACRFKAKMKVNEKKWEIAAETEGTNPEERQVLNGDSIDTMVGTDQPRPDLMSRPSTPRLHTPAEETDVLEVFFAGCHCDVGGGAVPNEQRHKLSQIPLRWMIRQCFECDTGIIFKSHRLAEEGIDIQTLYPTYRSLERPTQATGDALRARFENAKIPSILKRSSVLHPVNPADLHGMYYIDTRESEKNPDADAWVPEHAEDYFDAVQEFRDQLEISKTWWILEFMPIKVRIQPQDSDTWVKKVRMNLGRHRPVQEHHPNLHWTVEERIRLAGYKIKARVDKNAKWNVIV